MATGQLNLRTVKLGDNADTSKNFLIQVPAVADGSLSIQTESGVPVLSRSAAGVITLGAGQTWQDVTAGKALNTNYTNSSGQTIQAIVTFSSSATCTAVATVGGVSFYGNTQTSPGFKVSICFLVPPGGVYKVTQAEAGALSALSWMELR